MQLHQLEYFLAVSDAGGFTRGAERVHVVQSAVSAGIRQLESELGCALFERSHHAIALTAEGKALLPHARNALSSVSAGRDSVASARGTIVGTVTFGTMAHLGVLDIAGLLEDFHARYPEISVKLRQTTAGSRTSIEGLRAGTLDLALVSPGMSKSPGVVLNPVLSEPLVFLCWPNHALASASSVTITDIASEPFVDFPSGWGNRDAIDRLFVVAGLRRVINTEVTNFGLARELVRRRLGVAIIPASGAPNDGSLVTIPLIDAPSWDVFLAKADGRVMSSASKVFAEAILALQPGASLE